jgi:hypothetical protein
MWKLGDRTYNSVLEILSPSSFISGNTYSEQEPDIYIEFSPALHLQCGKLRENIWFENRTKQTDFNDKNCFLLYLLFVL